MNWQTVIGLEVHAQLKTNSKLFSSAPTTYGAPVNTQTSFIDAGYPGVLPVLNQKAVHLAIRFGLAIGAAIHNGSYFERKNYFYPDLPKGYQISQFQHPIITQGSVALANGKKIIIERAHLEEDAGKSLHEIDSKNTGIDLNRAGTPLLEIVTAPCLSSAVEAVEYLKTLHQLLRFLDICDGNMQEGSFRADVNLSLRRTEHDPLGTRVELKNLNSFRFIEKAIQYEAVRHASLLESGHALTQETRLYNPDTNCTELLRSKENENDYRYFPDPDLLPIQISNELIDEIRETMPPLPSELKQRLRKAEQLNEQDIDFLLTTPAHMAFFEEIKKSCQAPSKTIVNWLKGAYSALLNEKNLNFETPPISSQTLAHLLNHLHSEKISSHHAKTIFVKLAEQGASIEALITEFQNDEGLDTLDELVQTILNNFPDQVSQFKAGKQQVLGFFMGQAMSQTKGQYNPKDVQALFLKHLKLKR